MDDSIQTILKKYFPTIQSLRGPQESIIRKVIEGKNTLALMPTGSGKSLCYQIAGIAKGGITLVIFPLVALMDEQANILKKAGLDVCVLNGQIPVVKQWQMLHEMLKNTEQQRFILVSPERLAIDGFFAHVLRRLKDVVRLVVIDEAHCVSQWGDDFRPPYKEIPRWLNDIFTHTRWPAILCLTATLSPLDASHIRNEFRINNSNVVQHKEMLRNNISLEIVPVADEKSKETAFWNQLEGLRSEKVLVYANRKYGERSVEDLADKARQRGFKAEHFHADLSGKERQEIIGKLRDGHLHVVFATCAFGMGIDIPDIREIIHFLPPESVEAYYQQIGRAGRDGNPSRATLYYSKKNFDVIRSHFIDRSLPDDETIRNIYNEISNNSPGIKLFDYFSDDKQTALFLLLRSGLVTWQGRAVSRLNDYIAKGAPPAEFIRLQNASRSGSPILIAKKLGLSCQHIVELFFAWLADGTIVPKGAPAKYMILECVTASIDADELAKVSAIRDEIIQVKHSSLRAFEKILTSNSTSESLHQAIGRNLGIISCDVSKNDFSYETACPGVTVRSKSEVIITNILSEQKIAFRYEERLNGGGKHKFPDFTISVGETTVYWEHLGMLDVQNYRNDWEKKRAWYETHYPGQILLTVDGESLSPCAEALAKALSQGDLSGLRRSVAWQIAIGQSPSQLRPVCIKLADAALPDPDNPIDHMPYELTNDRDYVIGHSEMAWTSKNQKVALIDISDTDASQAFKGHGWTIVHPQDEDLIDTLRLTLDLKV